MNELGLYDEPSLYAEPALYAAPDAVENFTLEPVLEEDLKEEVEDTLVELRDMLLLLLLNDILLPPPLLKEEAAQREVDIKRNAISVFILFFGVFWLFEKDFMYKIIIDSIQKE